MQVFEWVKALTFSDLNYLNKLFSSLLIVLILWLLRFLLLKIVKHQTASENARYSWRKGTLYSVVFLSVILIGRHWFNGLEPILAFLGIIAAGLTISLKEVVLNLAGMLVILWRDVFVVGDRIQLAHHKGDVVGLGAFYFSILEVGEWVKAEQSTGRLIKIPNSLVISNPIINYTRRFPFIWDEISISVTFDSNWRKAREIMQSIAARKSGDKTETIKQHLQNSSDELIHYRYLEPKVYIRPENHDPSGIVLTLRYMCEPRKRRDTENELWEEILTAFEAESDITISR